MMCDELQEAVQSANKNIGAIAKTIDRLPIPDTFKGGFMHLSAERGFRFNKETLSQMEIIGTTGSEICLMILEGNHKKSGLIVAYHLATKLDFEKQRAEAVQIVSDANKALNEKNMLLAILEVNGRG